MLVLLAACGDASAPPSSPPPPPPALLDPWAVGLVMDSITPASRLHQSPWWALYIVIVGAAGPEHSGIAFQGTVGREEVGRLGRCLGPAGQLPGERSLAYVAIGDTLYSPDSIAYWTLVNRLANAPDALRPLLDSALANQLSDRIPGLVAITTGLFDPTASEYGRGATEQTAILRRWTWTDAGRTFAEDTARTSLDRCGLR
jgi:hypothetical protein